MDDNLHTKLASLEEELSKLKNAVEYIEAAKTSVEAAQEIIVGAKNLQENVEKHAKLIEELIREIDKVDFPSRLDKIDTMIVTINQNISNLQTRIDSSESNIRGDIKQRSHNIANQIEGESNKSKVLGEQIIKKQNVNTIFLFLIIILLVGLGILIKM